VERAEDDGPGEGGLHRDLGCFPRSRISADDLVGGSWRKMLRRQLAKVTPISSLTCT